VGVLARNCPEQVEVFFACAQRALIMVPLNWRLTPAELAYQVRDADPAVLLAEPGLMPLARAAAGQAGLPHLTTTLTSASGLPAAEASSGGLARDHDPLLILYTSGTTGRPKGAMLTHANCFWTNLSLDRTAEITGDDVVLQVLPQCHVAGWNVQPLLARWKGARVVLEQAFDAERALALISGRRVTTMMGVPTNYLMLAACPGFAGADLSSLRQVIAGGAPMPLPLIETWQARSVTVLQGYGLTEAAPNVLCVPQQDARRKAGSAGRPYRHVRVALRDLTGGDLAGADPAGGDPAGGDPAGDGLVEGPGTGEILVGGPNVFCGYWRDPQATEAARWHGWLTTGDVADRDADGFYWIRGRLKEMYISGGENVYPAEVEEALAAHPAVAEAAVIAVGDERSGETGLAFVAATGGRPVAGDDLAAFCRTRLAGYKVPRRYRLVAELPRLTSGKVDKLALARGLAAEAGTAPVGETAGPGPAAG
jgi:fatty-acyl-CoA synthase